MCFFPSVAEKHGFVQYMPPKEKGVQETDVQEKHGSVHSMPPKEKDVQEKGFQEKEPGHPTQVVGEKSPPGKIVMHFFLCHHALVSRN